MSDAQPERAWFALGLVVLGVGVWLLVDKALFVSRTVPAVGTVVDKGDTTYALACALPDGGTLRVTVPLPVSAEERGRIQPGQKLPVRFSPERPSEGRAVTEGFWLYPLGVLLVGALGVVAGVYGRRAPKRG